MLQLIAIIPLFIAPLFIGVIFAYRQEIFDFFSYPLSFLDNDEEHILYIKPYEEIYIEKFKNMTSQDLTLKQAENIYSENKNCNTFVMEYTPNGTIIMGYNYNEHAFYYFTNNSIHTKYIHSVALKYMLVTHTKWITQISMDENGNKSLIHNKNIIPFESSSEKEKENEKEKEKEKKGGSGGIVSKSGVMAKLKSRVDETKNNENNNKKDDDGDDDNSDDGDENENNFDIVSLLSNVKFVKLGRTSDFSLLKSHISENKTSNEKNNNTNQDTIKNTNEKLSFADYKKLIASKSA
jgi:ribosomal protein L35